MKIRAFIGLLNYMDAESSPGVSTIAHCYSGFGEPDPVEGLFERLRFALIGTDISVARLPQLDRYARDYSLPLGVRACKGIRVVFNAERIGRNSELEDRKFLFELLQQKIHGAAKEPTLQSKFDLSQLPTSNIRLTLPVEQHPSSEL
ncbi:MAG: hypothetical protein IT558_02465 [Alphaproteobacteria bacterium]|nr:hypothetical protein [Alphaproteobacteria bacterium]